MIGSLLGSPWFFPKCLRKHSYMAGIIGIPLHAFATFYYGIVVMAESENPVSTLAGALAPCISIGVVINLFYFWLEIRRIARNEIRLVARGMTDNA